jgi:hypothetical protein
VKEIVKNVKKRSTIHIGFGGGEPPILALGHLKISAQTVSGDPQLQGQGPRPSVLIQFRLIVNRFLAFLDYDHPVSIY